MTDRANLISDDLMFAADPNEVNAGFTFPGLYATMMARYMYDYGRGNEDCGDALAMVAVKNHHHAMPNENAQFRREFTDDPIYIMSSQQATDAISLYSRESLTSVKTTKLAVGAAMKEADVTFDDIQIAEVHDCFTVEEVMFLEDSGFYKTGEGWKGVHESYESGKGSKHIPYLGDGRELIVNPGGGLKADGHPVGATRALEHLPYRGSPVR